MIIQKLFQFHLKIQNIIMGEQVVTIKQSVYIRQNATTCNFSAESWVILSPIEQRIKAKIEAVGTPLKNWDIQINYGIKTGFNEAFIISGEKRKELIEQDLKSEEIIRPSSLTDRDKEFCWFASYYQIRLSNLFGYHVGKIFQTAVCRKFSISIYRLVVGAKRQSK
jgi:hypothetical protein